jgi:hypothetical protein
VGQGCSWHHGACRSDGSGASDEEEAKIEDNRKKRARGQPMWRWILNALKKTRGIIILNALMVIYGVRIVYFF